MHPRRWCQRYYPLLQRGKPRVKKKWWSLQPCRASQLESLRRRLKPLREEWFWVHHLWGIALQRANFTPLRSFLRCPRMFWLPALFPFPVFSLRSNSVPSTASLREGVWELGNEPRLSTSMSYLTCSHATSTTALLIFSLGRKRQATYVNTQVYFMTVPIVCKHVHHARFPHTVPVVHLRRELKCYLSSRPLCNV